MKLRVLFVFLALTAGCEESRTRPLGTRIDAGQIANATDGGASTTDGGAGGWNRACPAASGFDRVGRRWRMESTDAYEAQYGATYFQVSELVALDDLSDHLRVELSFEIDVEGDLPQGTFRLTSEGTFVFRCDPEGLSFVQEDTITDIVLPNDTSHQVDHKDYAPPLLELPADLYPGATWSDVANVTQVLSNDGENSTSSFEVATRGEIGPQQRVVTPAGNFEAWPVTVIRDGESSMLYWAEGVGRVADDAGHLTTYE